MVTSILEYLKAKIEKRLKVSDDHYFEDFLQECEWTELDCENALEYAIEYKEGNQDETDKQYWEMISDAGEGIDLTNFMFRLIIKKTAEDKYVLV